MKTQWLVLTTVMAVACAQDELPSPTTIVASVGSTQITLGTFAYAVRHLQRSKFEERSAPLDPSAYGELLDRMIDLELLSKEAERRSIATLPIAQKRMRKAMVEAYLDDSLRQLVKQRQIAPSALHKLRKEAVRLLLERLRQDSSLDHGRFATFGHALEDHDQELLAKEAERLGFHQRFATAAARKRILASLLLRSEADSGELQRPSISEAQVRKAYDDSKNRFHQAARMHVWVARLATAREAAELAHEVESLGVSDTAGHHDLLADYKSAPGLIVDVEDDDERVPTSVLLTLVETKRDGEVLGPIAADKGFYIARRLARVAAVDISFEQAKDRLAAELMRRAMVEASHSRARALETRWPVTKNTDAVARFATMQRQTIREI